MLQRDLMYCAIPSCFKERAKEATDIAWDAGFHPIEPFGIDRFRMLEATFGREQALRFLGDFLVTPWFNAFGLFGISDGTMYEVRRALAAHKYIRLFLDFHSGWENEYREWSKKYGDVLAHVRGPHRLIVLVGARASGKTFWMDRMIEKCCGTQLARVKNTTTRTPRNAQDHDSYRFITRGEFMKEVAAGAFLEWTEYEGNLYGSSFDAMRSALAAKNVLLALTPDGARALYERHRNDFNLHFAVLRCTEELFRENLTKRGILDPVAREVLLQSRHAFVLPPEIPHVVADLDGGPDDERTMLRLLDPYRTLPLPELPPLPEEG